MNDCKVLQIKMTAARAVNKRLTKFYGHEICLFRLDYEHAKQSCFYKTIKFQSFHPVTCYRKFNPNS